jgi:hypothetical protein
MENEENGKKDTKHYENIGNNQMMTHPASGDQTLRKISTRLNPKTMEYLRKVVRKIQGKIQT